MWKPNVVSVFPNSGNDGSFKDHVDKNKISKVGYELNCNNCSSIYIGRI